jgi:murein DD-endopeptidase MepM/ murein hydrolase activator NlpD
VTHAIDASFREKKQAHAAQRKRRLLRKIAALAGGFVLLIVAAVVYATLDRWSFRTYDGDLEPVAETDDIPDDAAVFVPAIVDLAGDPMLISLSSGAGGGPKVRAVARPADLVQPGISANIDVLTDTMVSSSERFMTTIPSSQEDFAFFQAQRSAAPSPLPAASGAPLAAPEAVDPAVPVDALARETFSDPAAGWGETVDQGEAELPEFRKTEIENTTSVAIVTPETERIEATSDIFVKVLSNRTLDSIVLENRFRSEDAKKAGEALKTLFSRDGLEAGFVVALRGFRTARDPTAMSLMQVSIYANDTFIGTLARDAAGEFVVGADPWVRDDLFHYSGEPAEGGHKRQYRLLDAIYSTAARNNVPTGVIGEAIMYLSRGQDLNAFATPDDRLTLIYSETGRSDDGSAGRVLYVAVRGGERNMECFVYQQSGGDFACVTGDDQVHSLTITNGMVTPTSGVMTSTFGPRRHPILKTVRIHKGVDWAAPIGTPIRAAFDGEIVFQGDGGDYGNLVRIAHSDGRETRYAHMSRFAIPVGAGTTVKAGDLIGYIGTSGLSTGPHLHFELYQGGTAVDPLGSVVAETSDGGAVEKLTDRIIHVESGGSATAKNPLSTATGLGQFIESTWVRMMNTYRPDLARSMSRADLLALRFDPTISREMVRNLAREGEAYLRARGHAITAGRLYLCHFLGMDGAAKILSSPGNASLADVLGSGVISANPFLTGKDASYVIAWAEKKMSGRAPRVATAPTVEVREVKQTSAEFAKYKTALTELVKSLTSDI